MKSGPVFPEKPAASALRLTMSGGKVSGLGLAPATPRFSLDKTLGRMELRSQAGAGNNDTTAVRYARGRNNVALRSAKVRGFRGAKGDKMPVLFRSRSLRPN